MISRDDIRAAYDMIRPYIRRTPVVQVDLGELDPAATGPSTLPALTLKLEQLQCAGSFKARGAFANLLLRDVPPAGVVAASGGNHGVAVAYAASRGVWGESRAACRPGSSCPPCPPRPRLSASGSSARNSW